MKYLSLFSGIGGFELGIQQAYEDKIGDREQVPEQESLSDRRNSLHSPSKGNGEDRNEHPTCIGYSEIDKYAIQIYQKHFSEHKNYGDITTIIASELPDFDLLVGGFPCQAFSIAGKRAGFKDTRGTLFFDIARILEAKKPRLFLLENVKGLLSHDSGRTFHVIISTLDELGYDLQWQVLNSKNFGVPQNRERVFIIGHLRGTPRPEVFPFGFGEGKDISSQRESDKSIITNSLDANYWKGDNRPSNKSGRAKVVMLGEHRTELGKLTRKEIRKNEGRDSTLRGKDHKEYRPNSHELANCITTSEKPVEKWLIENTKIRRLTPKECERLQGFPDGWTEGISDTQRYKCLGNAVTVNVIKAIVEKLKI